MKKAQRKLIPAFAMLLVSATMLSSASFAWFTMNSTVTAQGMKVEAVSPSNLLISTSQGGGSEIAESSLKTKIALQPASVTTLAGSQKFFKVKTATGITYSKGLGAVGTELVAADNDIVTSENATSKTNAGHVVKHTFYIKVGGTESTTKFDLHASSIEVTSASSESNVSKAIRVGVVCGDNGYIYAPRAGGPVTTQAVKTAGVVDKVEGTTAADRVLFKSNAELTAETTASNVPASVKSALDVLSDTVTTDGWTQVDVYIWYEGSDANCTTANAITKEGLNVKVVFEAEADDSTT